MANTIQKRIKFSKGQIVPELVERTDLELFDSSAQVMRNVVSSVYGGVRSRRGTKKIDRILGGDYTDVTGTATSSMGGTASYIQDKANTFTTGAVGSNRNIFTIQYDTEQPGSVLRIRGIKFDFREPQIRCHLDVGRASAQSGYEYDCWYYYTSPSRPAIINDSGVGLTSEDKMLANPNDPSKWYMYGSGVHDKQTRFPVFNITFDSKGSITTLNCEAGALGNYRSYGGVKRSGFNPTSDLIFQRNSQPRSYTASVYKSSDGVNWTYLETKTISESAQDFDIAIPDSFFYVKMELDATDDVIGTTISMQYACLGAGTFSKGNVRLVDFVYNNDNKYLLSLTDENICVYEDDELITTIKATGLTESLLENVRWTSKDDTIVFTHQDMSPKILKHNSDGTWTWGDLDLQNIPYTTFAGETKTPKTVNITPSAEEGAIKMTAASNIFDSSWVGQIIDGNGGRMVITEYISQKIVNGYTTIPFYTKDAISSWDYISGYVPVWGYENPLDTTTTNHGYPRTCLFAQQRLWFGGSRDKPATVWASRIGDYFNFKNSGNFDNDSIDVDLLTNDVIVNMVDCRGIHIFTTGQEITAQEGTYTPDKIAFVTNTQNGSLAKVRPVVIAGAVCYVEKNGKSLLSYVYNYDQASYVSDNISLFSNLVQNPVSMTAEINSSKDRGDFLYLVLEDGTMLVGCVLLSQNIMSLSQFVTEGKIRDVCSIGGETYIVVDRGTYNYIEKIVDIRTDDTVQTPVYPKPTQTLYGWEYDGTVIYTTSATPSVGDAIVDRYADRTANTISAVDDGEITVGGDDYTRTDDSNDTTSIMYVSVLTDFSNKLVYIYDDEELYQQKIAIDGKVELDKAINKTCYIGLPFDYEIEGNPIAINHKTNSIKKRITTAEITCEDTPRLIFCGQEKDSQDVYKFYSCTKYDNDVRYKIEGEFYPMHILSIQLNINYEG